MKETPVISRGKKKRKHKGDEQEEKNNYQNMQQNLKEKEGRRMWRKNFQRLHIQK